MRALWLTALVSASLLAASQVEVPSQLRPTKNPSLRSPGLKQGAPWYLGSFMEMADTQPEELFKIGISLFRATRLKEAKEKNSLAYDWQHRMALISAMSQIFDPKNSKKHSIKTLVKAKKFIEFGMIHDPALIVRDAAVESVRRLIRMNPAQSRTFKKTLERAFYDKKNILDGEGLFIRETILTALREASLPLSPQLKRAALADKNGQVRALVGAWNTRAFDTL